MKTNKPLIVASFMIALLASTSCQEEDEVSKALWEQEVERVKSATMQYVDFDKAASEGFVDVSGYVPQMGHHYMLMSRVDDKFELEKPEILLYVPDADGNMEFLGVEYSILVDDPANPGNPPEGFAGDQDQWHFREELAQWQLHVWTVKDNPDGIFASHNPDVNAE